MTLVVFGSLALVFALAAVPQLGLGLNVQGVAGAAMILLFGFLFVTVSSRLTGEVGSSSNPISGMTIATLILTCLLFVGLGWTGDIYSPIALSVGAIVCIAASVAGATSQDLKTGFIVGATPRYQQIGLMIGVVTATRVIGVTVLYMHRVFGIGSAAVPAPQATLMATIIRGQLTNSQPWGLVLTGVFLALTLELCGVRSLTFAVGAYLPIATTAPIFTGGLVRAWVERRTGAGQDSDVSSGTLFSSGLIAGGSIAGIVYAILVGTGGIGPLQVLGNAFPFFHQDTVLGQLATAALFFGLAVIVARVAMRKVE
jgi:putative OPT family oligopeptide transporter